MLELDKKDVELLKNDRSAILKAEINSLHDMMSQEITQLRFKMETIILANTQKKQFIQSQISEVQGTLTLLPTIIDKLASKTLMIEETFGK